MSGGPVKPPGDKEEEITSLLRRLHELTDGRIDAGTRSHEKLDWLHETLEKLHASKQQFRSLFTAAATGIAISTPQGRYLKANEAYCRMLGYTENELLMRDFASLTHPEDLRLNLELRDDLLAGRRESFVLEKRYLKKNGDIVWTRHSISAARTAEGKIETLMVIAEDITQRKQAEEQLHQQRAELLLLFDLIPASVWLKDTQHRVLRVNQRAANGMGKPVEAIEGKFTGELYPEQEAAVYKAEAEKVIRSGLPTLGLVKTWRNSEGRERWIQKDIVPVRDDHGQVRAVIVMAQDITESKRTEQALRESDERFRQLADNIDQVFWLLDLADRRVLYVSPAFERIWGRTGEALLADSGEWLDGVHPDDRQRVAQSTASAANGENSDLEYRVVHPNGSERRVHSRGFPVRDDKGAIWRVAGLTEDITERRKMEAQILRAQRTESLGTLASGIAHDLNNVLSPILMAVELLRTQMPPQRRAELLATLETSAQRGAGMVRQVLMFARGVEGERVPLKPEQLLREIEHIIRETFPRMITIKSEVTADCSPVLGDLTQLQQALLNLCVNSRDAMPDGGQLTLSAANVMLDDHFVATIPGARTGPHVVLQVSDTGTGIPAGIIERIFDPFFTTKEVGKGTGLGLSTLQAIVKSHSGFVSVYSEPQRGTTFKLYLPAAGEGASPPAASANSDLPRGNGELVLLADDEEAIRTVARSTLEAFGYRVLVAADGAEAVALFAQHTDEIALLLTDMMMPIMDGPTTVAAIRRIRPGVRVIASSGLTSMRELAKGVPSQVKFHLHKPYSADKLLKMVRQALLG